VGISIAARKYDFSAITPFETSDILDLRPGSCKLLREFAKTKYEFELPELSKTTVKKIYVLCNLSQKVGISIAARKYDFSAITPFETSDILDLRPVIKHSVPVCSEAKDLAEMRKVQLAEGILRDIEDHDIGAAVSHSSIVSLETIKLLEEKPVLPRIKRRINLSPRRISEKLLQRKVCHRI
ncbi:hypothetical protein AALP_AAs60056U000100, partial [Arabis alpina]